MIILVNFKTNLSSQKALSLAKSLEKVSKNLIVGVQTAYIKDVSKKIKLKVFAQHVDPFKPGRYTGFVLPEAVKREGAKGAFLNHSEHPISFKSLKETVKRCKQIKLKTAVFAKNLKEAQKIKKLRPDFLIIEPPELVGGKKSISQAKPNLISQIKNKLKYPFLVGAGIHTREDVKIAMKLGAKGFAISSAITKSKTPGKKLRELIK